MLQKAPTWVDRSVSKTLNRWGKALQQVATATCTCWRKLIWSGKEWFCLTQMGKWTNLYQAVNMPFNARKLGILLWESIETKSHWEAVSSGHWRTNNYVISAMSRTTAVVKLWLGKLIGENFISFSMSVWLKTISEYKK